MDEPNRWIGRFRGQKVAVVGESGSGKSTVMALLERVLGRKKLPGSDVALSTWR